MKVWERKYASSNKRVDVRPVGSSFLRVTYVHPRLKERSTQNMLHRGRRRLGLCTAVFLGSLKKRIGGRCARTNDKREDILVHLTVYVTVLSLVLGYCPFPHVHRDHVPVDEGEACRQNPRFRQHLKGPHWDVLLVAECFEKWKWRRAGVVR